MKVEQFLPYRPEIDGLRAWAVSLVLLAHAGMAALPGGFVGVDIFFVISGYLITRILIHEVQQGRFSLLDFYIRRVRRLVPALLVLTAVILLFGAACILPLSLERISSSAVSALLFYSNVHFWLSSTNYFAPAASTDPFLHTWSLAAEAQFYLFFPPLFLLLMKFGRMAFILTATGLTFVSFVIALFAYQLAPTGTFFLPTGRAWEFLVGSLLATRLIPAPTNKMSADFGTMLGLGLVVVGASAFDSSTQFPGWATLLPVAGAALVIHCSQTGGLPTCLLLRWEPIRQIGLISYSLYLWHWPILVFAKHYYLGRSLSGLETFACICLSFGAAALSYRFVEQPFRSSALSQRRTRLLAALLPAFAIALLGAESISKSGGLADRYPTFDDFDMVSQLEEEQALHSALNRDCFLNQIAGSPVTGCHLGPRGNRNTLIWGDSFARHYLIPIIEATNSNPLPEKRGLISLVSPACPPIFGYDPAHLKTCKSMNERGVTLLDEMNVDTVILSANWFNYDLVNRLDIEDIRSTVRALQERGVRVVLIGQSPIFTFTSPQEALFKQVRSSTESTRLGLFPNSVGARFNERLRERAGADVFVDPTNYLCAGELCQFHAEEGYLFSDYGHLTLIGARLVVDPILNAVGSDD